MRNFILTTTLVACLILPMSLWANSDESLQTDIRIAVGEKLSQIFYQAPSQTVSIQFRLQNGIVHVESVSGAQKRMEKRIMKKLDGKLLDKTFGTSDLLVIRVREQST